MISDFPLRIPIQFPWLCFYTNLQKLIYLYDDTVQRVSIDERVLVLFTNNQDHIVVFTKSSLQKYVDREWQNRSRAERYHFIVNGELSYAEEILCLLEREQYATINFTRNCAAIHYSSALTDVQQIVALESLP